MEEIRQAIRAVKGVYLTSKRTLEDDRITAKEAQEIARDLKKAIDELQDVAEIGIGWWGTIKRWRR